MAQPRFTDPFGTPNKQAKPPGKAALKDPFAAKSAPRQDHFPPAQEETYEPEFASQPKAKARPPLPQRQQPKQAQ